MDKERMAQAYESIEEMLKGDQQTARAFQELIEPLARGLITKVTVKLDKKTTIRLGVTADGNLRIERSDLATQAEEI